jgi:hypothetical protein
MLDFVGTVRSLPPARFASTSKHNYQFHGGDLKHFDACVMALTASMVDASGALPAVRTVTSLYCN